ncbi:MAG: hypothetical protein IJ688_14650 [Treponema sp.]|nr:hypothetical protein [Treponema sp.]
MSSLDTTKPFNNSVSEKQFNGFFIPRHNAKIIKESIENGTAPFLPDRNGNVNAKPIYNGNTGYCLNAKDLIPLKVIQGEKSDRVVTYKTVNDAHSRINAGEKGFFYNFQREDKTVGTSQFFFLDQVEHPERVNEAVDKKIESANAKLPKLNKTIEIPSANPEEYLGMYVAACKSGASLKVSPQIAEEFKQNFTAVLNNQLAKKDERTEGIDKLSDFMYKVDQKANAINKELRAEYRQEHQKEFKPKQNNRKPVEMEM